ncbi:MAG: biotin/lipoyl-binding protein [Candidatus Gracilibacteria bacterium]
MKKILYILILSLFLFSCSNEIEEMEVVKKDFFIETKKIDDFPKDLAFKKTGKVSSSQDIKLSSQVSGRVGNIYVKEGEEIKKGNIISRLEDNIANYGLSLERAQNALDKARINYESTENQLDKNISDLKINLDNLKIDEYNSKSSLELEKIDNTAKKMALDYENLKISNVQTIEGFKNSLSKDLISFTTFTDDIIYFADRLLGLTVKNKNANDDFEEYLGAKNSAQKKIAEDLSRSLINYRENELTKVNYGFEGNTGFDSNLLIIENGYSIITSLLNNLETTLDNSIPSIGSLSEENISGYKLSISSFWISFNSHNTGFVSFRNTINSFLDTYLNSEASLLKQIELLLSDKKIYIKGLDTRLEIDESTLEEAINNKQLTLRQLDTIITDANIGYKQALNNYNKLVIKSPISGVIGEIFIDVGQEVGPGTPLFNISNNRGNEIIISFSKNELFLVEEGNIVNVLLENITYTGSIYSISNIADSNLKYISRISFRDGIDFTGDVVEVSIPFVATEKLLPVNIMKVDDYGKGVINVLIDGEIHKRSLTIGNIYGDKVEILEVVNPDQEIIITNIDNFDTNKFNLKLK